MRIWALFAGAAFALRYDLISNKKTFDGFLSNEVESKPVKIRSIIKSMRTDQQIGQLLSWPVSAKGHGQLWIVQRRVFDYFFS